MMDILFLTADAAATAEQGPASLFSMFLPMILLIAVFYFLLIRPEKKRKKEVDAMRSGLKRGDVITTIGGIVGKITNVNDEEDLITIETGSDKVKIRIARWAVGTKNDKTEESVETVAQEKIEENND